MTQAVTAERIERALVVVAYAMEKDGPIYAPLFERLERELAETRRLHSSTTARARQLLERHTINGDVRSLR